jgi:hypothetical protein
MVAAQPWIVRARSHIDPTGSPRDGIRPDELRPDEIRPDEIFVSPGVRACAGIDRRWWELAAHRQAIALARLE